MALKRTQADKYYSACIRERTNWTCELCGTHYPDSAAKGNSKSLDCSHLVGRGNWSVRFDAINAFCHCYGCHSRFGADADLQKRHHLEIFGNGLYDILMERKNDSGIGRMVRKAEKLGEVRRHYKAEFERMRKERANGEQGRIEFISYV
jgi:hypothetical protein